ncbi:Nuclear pore complex, Nup98 component (sc Nup145/Nup100/Nup116), partial [Pseudoloma neurophilia]
IFNLKTQKKMTFDDKKPSFFGNTPFFQQDENKQPFGQSTANKPGGLFGQSTQTFGQQNPTFGQPNTAFGQNNTTFGATQQPSNTFGSSLFGQSSNTGFQTSNTPFGGQQQPSTTFGSSTFGQQQPSTTFGGPTTFGSNQTGLFGQQQPTTSNTTSTFGNNQTGLGFDKSQTTSPMFGRPTTSLFGNTGFGSQQATNTFGSSTFGQQQPSSTFGSTTFGQQPSTTFGGTTFGQQQSNTTSHTNFGTTPFSGQQNTSSFAWGTASDKKGSSSDTYKTTQIREDYSVLTLHDITAMNAYNSKNVDEIRKEDYDMGRKHSSMTSTPSTLALSGNTPFSNVGSGNTAIFGQNNTTGSTLFGQQPNTSTGGLFGQQTNTSGSNTGLFSFNQPSANITSNTNTPNTGLFGQQPNTSTSLFGQQPNTTTGNSLFGQQQNTSTGLFNNSTSLQPNTTQRPSLFGQTNTQPVSNTFSNQMTNQQGTGTITPSSGTIAPSTSNISPSNVYSNNIIPSSTAHSNIFNNQQSCANNLLNTPSFNQQPMVQTNQSNIIMNVNDPYCIEGLTFEQIDTPDSVLPSYTTSYNKPVRRAIKPIISLYEHNEEPYTLPAYSDLESPYHDENFMNENFTNDGHKQSQDRKSDKTTSYGLNHTRRGIFLNKCILFYPGKGKIEYIEPVSKDVLKHLNHTFIIDHNGMNYFVSNLNDKLARVYMEGVRIKGIEKDRFEYMMKENKERRFIEYDEEEGVLIYEGRC